jgi:hypothetical protein
MGYLDGGATSLTRAKTEARQIVSDLHVDDVANVVLCGAHPTAVLDAPADDRTSLLKAIDSASVTGQLGNPADAVAVAAEQIDKSQAPVRKVYFFSDFQRTNWANVKFDSLPKDAALAFVSTTSADRSNAGVTSIQLYPPRPRIGEPVSVRCEVFNSSGAARTLPLTLTCSNGVKQVQTVQLEPFSSANAAFSLEFDTAQRVECTASIPSDALPVDDSRRVVIDLARVPIVVLVTDESAAPGSGGAYYLARSLHPSPQSLAGFRVALVKSNALTAATLSGADAVAVCDAPGLGASQLDALGRYAAAGGNLVWFLYGGGIDTQMAAFASHLPASEPLPLQVQNIENLSGNGKGYVSLAEAKYESPLLRVFKDPSAADISKARFTKVCVTGEVDSRAETLLKFDDGTPALVRSTEGAGNLLLVNMAPDPAWGDLPKQESFVPLMQEFLKGLMARDTGVRDCYPGEAASTVIASGIAGAVTCTGPTGDIPVSYDKSTGSVLLDRAPAPGFYRVYAGGSPAATVAVNIHPDETDLRSIDPRELESQSQRGRSVSIDAAVGDSSAALRSIPVWQFAVLAAIAFLLLEQSVARVRPPAGGAK